MNTVNAHDPVAQNSPAELPALHLIVPPPGEHTAIEQALDRPADLPVLRWRRAAQTVRLVNDSELTDLLNAQIRAGGDVAVWHGEMSLSSRNLRQRLGDAWGGLVEGQVTWALICSVNTPDTLPWSKLAERLDRPDEMVVRRMLFSGGQVLPKWSTLSDALNLQARIAHAAWYQVHLAPLNEALDELGAEGAQAQQAEPEVKATPVGSEDASDDPLFEAPRAKVQTSRLSGSSLSASSSVAGAGATRGEVISAQLQPTGAAMRWWSERWREPGVSARAGEVPPLVQINFTRTPGRTQFQVKVLFPLQDRDTQWCLWLYPEHGFPIGLRIPLAKGETEALPVWSTAEDSQPDADLWDAIRAGSVGLDRVDE